MVRYARRYRVPYDRQKHDDMFVIPVETKIRKRSPSSVFVLFFYKAKDEIWEKFLKYYLFSLLFLLFVLLLFILLFVLLSAKQYSKTFNRCFQT